MPQEPVEIIGPASSYYVSQRLRLHYVDWGNEGAPLLVLIHGGRDHARSWDWVARDLRRDFHVVAPDLRGHGDSAWAQGGSYTIPEFVLDIARLIEALGDDRVILVAHSLGGAIALQYASVYPERVDRLVAIEGLGPSPKLLADQAERPYWERIEAWIEQMRGLAARQPRRYPSIEAAAARMLEVNGFLSSEQAHHLTIHGIARNEDGSYCWKFDTLVRSFFPARMELGERRRSWSRIICPTLLVRGEESWASDPESDGRMSAFPDARLANVAKAGHWVHHDRLDVFLEAVRSFLEQPAPDQGK